MCLLEFTQIKQVHFVTLSNFIYLVLLYILLENCLFCSVFCNTIQHSANANNQQIYYLLTLQIVISDSVCNISPFILNNYISV